MKKIFFGLILMCVPLCAQADIVLLKNGTVVNGRIAERDAKKLKLDVNGVPLTYYIDEIRAINGVDPQAVVNPPAAVPAPAPVAVQVPQAQMPATQPAPTSTPAVPSGLSKRELILKFIDAFGTRESLVNNFDQLIKKSPPERAEKIKKAFDVDQLIEALIPIYDKRFTEEELQAYINFYSSPEGKKLIQTLPVLMMDSVGVSLKYFKERLPDMPVKEVN